MIRPVSVKSLSPMSLNLPDVGGAQPGSFPLVTVLTTNGLTASTFTPKGASHSKFDWLFDRSLVHRHPDGGWMLRGTQDEEDHVLGHSDLNFQFDWNLQFFATSFFGSVTVDGVPEVEITFRIDPNPYWSRLPKDANATAIP